LILSEHKVTRCSFHLTYINICQAALPAPGTHTDQYRLTQVSQHKFGVNATSEMHDDLCRKISLTHNRAATAVTPLCPVQVTYWLQLITINCTMMTCQCQTHRQRRRLTPSAVPQWTWIRTEGLALQSCQMNFFATTQFRQTYLKHGLILTCHAESILKLHTVHCVSNLQVAVVLISLSQSLKNLPGIG